jgi:hypothetical protein
MGGSRLIGHLKFSLCVLIFALTALTRANAASLLVRGGTLIDGTGGNPIADARILITDGRIAKVWSGDGSNSGAPAIPAGTQIVEAGGKFIIPGLIDSHVHYNWYMGELFLSHGVTTVFDLGGGPVWSIAVQKGLNSGQIAGPRYYFHGVFGGGGTGQTDSLAGTYTAKMRFNANVATPADAPKAVAALKGKADIITLNEEWKGEYFKAVASAAHANGLSIISHSFNAVDTSDWGVDGIEHMTGVGIAAARSPEARKAVAAMGFCTHQYAPILEQSLPCIAAGHKNSKLYQWMDPSYFDEMIQHLVRNHTFLNPTLDFEWKGIIDRTPQFELEDQRLFFNPALQYVPEDERLVTLGQYHWADTRTASDREEFLTGYKKVQEFLRKFVAAGGKLYSGTDSASANTPGLALHHEMQLFVDAGIPPMQALLSSTKWPAEMARMDKNLGTVEAGKYGDLVILAADPLKDIHNTQTIEKVIKAGVVQNIGYHAGYEVPFHLTGPLTKHLYSQPPVVANLEPALVAQGGEVWVRVTGANFSPNSVVLFDGKPVETKFVGDNEIDGRLTAKQTSHPGNYLIGVETPKPGGGVTEGLGFIVDYR